MRHRHAFGSSGKKVELHELHVGQGRTRRVGQSERITRGLALTPARVVEQVGATGAQDSGARADAVWLAGLHVEPSRADHAAARGQEPRDHHVLGDAPAPQLEVLSVRVAERGRPLFEGTQPGKLWPGG